jgi:hypothetical protein
MSTVGTVIKNYAKVVALFLPASILPAIAGLLDLAPPLPHGIIAATTAYELIVLLICYSLFRKQNFRLLRKILISALFGSMFGFLLYLAAMHVLVFDMPNGEKGIAGLVCTNAAQIVYPDNCPFLTEVQLAEANYDSSKLFTGPSRAASIGILNALWFVFFLLVALSVSAFASNEVYVARKRSP